MIESAGRTQSVAPDQPKPELPRSVEWLVKTLTFLIRARRAALLIGGMSWEAAHRRAGAAPVCDPYPAVDVETSRRFAAGSRTASEQAMTLPSTHGMQLLVGQELDDVVTLLVACGMANSFVTAEPGGWATTSQRLAAQDVAWPRVEAAHRVLEEDRIELVRRPR